MGGTTAPQPLTREQLDQAAKTVKDPTFDIYVGKYDGHVHRMSGNLALSVPEADRVAGQRHHRRLAALHAGPERRQRRPEVEAPPARGRSPTSPSSWAGRRRWAAPGGRPAGGPHDHRRRHHHAGATGGTSTSRLGRLQALLTCLDKAKPERHPGGQRCAPRCAEPRRRRRAPPASVQGPWPSSHSPCWRLIAVLFVLPLAGPPLLRPRPRAQLQGGRWLVHRLAGGQRCWPPAWCSCSRAAETRCCSPAST